MKSDLCSREALDVFKIWKNLSVLWKTVRRDFSEACVHDFRVNIRRMICALEVAAIFEYEYGTTPSKVAFLIGKFKRVLKTFGPLRDIQVEQAKVASLRDQNLERRFTVFLKRQEKEELRKLEHQTSERKRKGLHRRAKAINRSLQKVLLRITKTPYRTVLKQNVDQKYRKLMSVFSNYCQASDAQSFHKVRIEFKRFRYAAEAAQGVCRLYTVKQFERMRALQDNMGDIHDIEILISELKDWAGNGWKIDREIVKATLSELERKHDSLIAAFDSNPAVFDEFALETRFQSIQRPSAGIGAKRTGNNQREGTVQV